jgi:hypothetical protein
VRKRVPESSGALALIVNGEVFMPMPNDVVNDMQNEARKYHRDDGFVRMLDGSFGP